MDSYAKIKKLKIKVLLKRCNRVHTSIIPPNYSLFYMALEREKEKRGARGVRLRSNNYVSTIFFPLTFFLIKKKFNWEYCLFL